MNAKPPSEYCPNCGTQGIGHVMPGVFDGILYYSCPRDYTRYHRFPEGDRLREKAKRFVEMTG